MAASRLLKDTTQSKKINGLSAEAEVCFYRLIMKADDFGNFYGHPSLVKSALFPFKDDLSSKMVEEWVEELSKAELIRRYESAGTQYVHIYDFGQRLRTFKGKFPKPDGDEDYSVGYVYFIGSSETEPIKIGFSLNPWARVKELATANHQELKIMACFKGIKATEKNFHAAFKVFNTKSEWFDIPIPIFNTILSFSKEDEAEKVLEQLRSNYEQLRSVLKGNTNTNTKLNTKIEIEYETELPFGQLFAEKWKEWVQYRKEIKKSYKSKKSEEQAAKSLERFNEEFAITLINRSMNNTWQGLIFENTEKEFKKFTNGNGATNNREQRSDTINNLKGLAERILDDHSAKNSAGSI